MKNEIVSTQYFELAVDGRKNRLYITSKGFWNTEAIVDEYWKFQTEALKQLKPNFTVVADMCEFKILPQDLVPKQKQTQLDLANAGLYKVAVIVPGSAVAGSQLKNVVKDTKMPEEKFSNIVEAESWLDKAVLEL